MESLIKFRDKMREAADIIDELIALKSQEDGGANIEKECESVLGRFMIKMLELQTLQEKL